MAETKWTKTDIKNRIREELKCDYGFIKHLMKWTKLQSYKTHLILIVFQYRMKIKYLKLYMMITKITATHGNLIMKQITEKTRNT